MTIWFTSDQHYGHSNIIVSCKRPFHDADTMNHEMISRYRSKVKPEDTVYFLGDVAFVDPRPILAHLPGHKFLIIGNHDQKRRKDLGKSEAFGWIKDVEEIEVQGQKIWTSHYPHRSWPSSYHGSWHLHGHTHGSLPNLPSSRDVGVDCWDFYPVSFETLATQLATKRIDA